MGASQRLLATASSFSAPLWPSRPCVRPLFTAIVSKPMVFTTCRKPLVTATCTKAFLLTATSAATVSSRRSLVTATCAKPFVTATSAKARVTGAWPNHQTSVKTFVALTCSKPLCTLRSSSAMTDMSSRQLIEESCPKPLRSVKGKGASLGSKPFVDFKEVRVYGGKGGDGRISFLSVYMIEFAGPDGGNGGHGGHVIFTASPRVSDLSHVKSVEQAAMGQPGGKDDMHGKDAKHRVVEVPVGTIIRNPEGAQVCDLDRPGCMFLAARGGAGGKGNANFKSSTNQAPKISEMGAHGEILDYTLELRTMADVGLIGFPNAGKSTLLQAISRARPKVASYPFTTLNPHIGMVPYDDLSWLAVADLPGLLPGASRNYGLGYAFLRHVERCPVLLYVIDLGDVNNSPLEQLDQLRYELNTYQAGLGDRPAAVLANKTDLPETEERLRELEAGCQLEVLPTSGKTGRGLTYMLTRLKQIHSQYSQQKDDDDD